MGPQDCRTICSAEFACAEGETCQLVPHGGLPLEDVELDRACVPEAAAPGCDPSGCSDCADSQIGRTFCDGTLVRGCLLAINPVCGVSCESVVIQDCEMEGTCELVPLGARCSHNSYDDPCVDFPCSSCTGDLVPGGAACEGNAIAACLSTRFPGTSADCDKLTETVEECVSQHAACGSSSLSCGSPFLYQSPHDACGAMDAAAVGNEDGNSCNCFLGYAWNGLECVSLSDCACEGADCDKLTETLEACQDEHATCG